LSEGTGPLRLSDGSLPDLYFVDLDGTLISRSSEKYFLAGLFRKRILGLTDMARFISGYLLHPLLTAREGKGWNRTYLRGLDPEKVELEASSCAAVLIRDHLRPWTASSIDELSSAGRMTVLLSASLEPIARGVAAGLRIPKVRASVPEVSDGLLTGRLASARPWGRRKVDLAVQICREHGTDLQRCAAAGDSWSDSYLLRECGCPVAVCPDSRLRAAAEEGGWTMVGGRHTRWA
jgi:putative phosphoserine phosphatase/1-acylglycerol-3-phosphate O-acyltransferase